MNKTKIVVVEDNPLDVRLLRYALERYAEWQADIVAVLQDGEEAIQYFGEVTQNPPDLLILDLNLPKKNGAEVIKTVRNKLSLRRLAVIIFSSSPEDVVRLQMGEAYALANAYLTKPFGLEGFVALPKKLQAHFERSSQSYETYPLSTQ